MGGAVIDATPTPVKEFAVRELGTYDKPVLLGSIALVLAVFTAVVGILAVRRRIVAVVGAAVFGVGRGGRGLSRPAATAYDVVPSLVGAAVAAGVLILLLHRAYRRPLGPSGRGAGPGRRRRRADTGRAAGADAPARRP